MKRFEIFEEKMEICFREDVPSLSFGDLRRRLWFAGNNGIAGTRTANTESSMPEGMSV